jgi:glycosyltransferase involved in cell wall biosynthesis
MNMALGFWESFPHSHRRFEQALHEKKAIFRKRLEFWFSSRNERSAIGRCDFYMPITETHKSIYYPDLTIPYFATPMGFDFQRYPLRGKLMGGGPIKFVHIGTVDALRRIDMVNSAFMAQNKDYILDYYTYSRNDTVDQLRKISDLRIRVHEGLPQSRLFEAIRQADVGVCFFPHTKTHITASPTKTIEYGALGLTILVNPMPEYQRLIDAEYAFVCDFNEIAIRNKVEEILNVDRFTLYQMGRQFQRRVFEQRNYDQMAKELFSFIDHQVVLKTGSR